MKLRSTHGVASEARAGPAFMIDSLSQARVLVVDDDAPIRATITAMLKAEGAGRRGRSGALEACRRNAFSAP
jgi:PleD family two-component response regulator